MVGSDNSRYFSPEIKLKAVMESFQRDTTIEEVRRRFGVSKSAINNWRKQFKEFGPRIFNFGKKRRTRPAEESPEELKKIIGDLTVQLEVLKKAQRLLS
jgi:transposase-like protein